MKKYIITAFMAFSLALTGCRDWLDINENPNYPTTAEAYTLIPSIEMVTASSVGYQLTLVGSFWSQYVNQYKSSNQYNTVMNYELTTQSSWFSYPWRYTYDSVLPAIKTILVQTENVEGKENYVFISKALLAYNLYLLTSCWDGVAYTNGYLSDGFLSDKPNANPKFDTGEQMQVILLDMLKGLREMDFDAVQTAAEANDLSKYEVMYNADMDKWLEFVNTLYLKLLLRDFEVNKTEIQALLSEDKFLSEDFAYDLFMDEANKSNPLYENNIRQLNTTNNIRTCTDILNVLDESDPRLLYYYTNLVGTQYGITPDQASKPGLLRMTATDPVYFSTIDEALFLKAEAYARLDDAANAQSNYENAIKASFTRIGVEGADALIANQYAFQSGSAEEMVEQIINQKWAANVRCMPIESWFDLSRTGYPTRGKTITEFTGTIDGQPHRFFYPFASGNYNVNAPKPVELKEKMWWQK